MGDPFHVTEKRQKERSRIHPGQRFPVASSGQSVFLLPLFAISAAEDGDTYVIRVAGELGLAGDGSDGTDEIDGTIASLSATSGLPTASPPTTVVALATMPTG